jgi:TfoX/Sxy family transcriptional regulator of competence genes
MAWKKSSPELIARFSACLPDDPLVERRSMFGYPCAFVQGHMVSGLHEERLIVRLPADERDALMAEGGAIFSPMPGRLMKEYVVVPPALVAKHQALCTWVARAVAYGTTLPPKAAKAPKAPKPPKAAKPARRAAAEKRPAKKR